MREELAFRRVSGCWRAFVVCEGSTRVPITKWEKDLPARVFFGRTPGWSRKQEIRAGVVPPV